MDGLIQMFFTDSATIALSLDSIVKFMVFVMMFSSFELIACSLGKVRDK